MSTQEPDQSTPVEPTLIAPTIRVKRSFLEALPHYQAENRYLTVDQELLDLDFGSYVDGLIKDSSETSTETSTEKPAEGISRPAGRVPATTLWFCAGEEYLGRVVIRHRLTPQLRLFGGHIGYDVVPSARGKGYATRMLALALPIANDMGIDPALVTCDTDNVASRKVIEANGGVLAERSEAVLRFWLPTKVS